MNPGDLLGRLHTQKLKAEVAAAKAEAAGLKVRNTADAIRDADLVVGGVLIPGAAAPKLVSREQLSHMRPGSVLVDVAIDQGGCFETSRPTTHAEPTYIIDDIVHYCVANMPGAVPRTSTFALNNVTLPFTLQLADKGAKIGTVTEVMDQVRLAGVEGVSISADHPDG